MNNYLQTSRDREVMKYPCLGREGQHSTHLKGLTLPLLLLGEPSHPSWVAHANHPSSCCPTSFWDRGGGLCHRGVPEPCHPTTYNLGHAGRGWGDSPSLGPKVSAQIHVSNLFCRSYFFPRPCMDFVYSSTLELIMPWLTGVSLAVPRTLIGKFAGGGTSTSRCALRSC